MKPKLNPVSNLIQDPCNPSARVFFHLSNPVTFPNTLESFPKTICRYYVEYFQKNGLEMV